MQTLTKDPLNLIIAGVGGQGNIRLSGIIGSSLIRKGYFVTIGNTLGASQRGGSVVSHVRISSETWYGPFTVGGRADIILGMEPLETLRALRTFGNPDVITILNPRPIFPVVVLSGEVEYPDMCNVVEIIRELSARSWIINATDEALKLGNPAFANVILLGALVGANVLPLDKESVEPVLREEFPTQVDANR